CVTNQPESSSVNHTNFVRTSRYTWYDFLPRNLLDQFKNVANCYFVLTAILQSIGPISDSDGQPTILVGLLPIMMAVAVREGLEDRARHRNDARENKKIVERFKNGNVNPTQWKDLQVGDVIRVRK
ncbi:unnamed protein product, partial [Amoebophrya sp. A25]